MGVMKMTEMYREDWTCAEELSGFAGRIARVINEPTALTNVRMGFAEDYEDGMLNRLELEVLMNLALTYLDNVPEVPCAPAYGSLIICSRMADWLGDLKLTNLLADLREGPCSMPGIRHERLSWRELAKGEYSDPVMVVGLRTTLKSRDEVYSAAWEALHYRENMEPRDGFLRHAKFDGAELRSGLYFDKRIYGLVDADQRMALVLNGDVWRYAMSFCCWGQIWPAEMLTPMAQALACLRAEDVRLQKSVQMVRKQLAEDDPLCVKVMDAVAQTFAEGRDPLLKNWQEWRNKTNP